MAALSLMLSAARADPIPVVAAENFYGDVVRQIGGDAVAVVSILANPSQDPHEFEADAATARRVAKAKVVIDNGIGYDPWLPRLLAASPAPARTVITAAALLGRRDGDNPHLWYDPPAMPAVAAALADALASLDPAHAAVYRSRLAAFRQSLQPLAARIAAMRRKYSGTPVSATEPVFGYMAAALGLVMRNQRFQLAVMNDTEPGATEIAAFEQDLRSHAVSALLYNRQTGGALSDRMRQLARSVGVPVVGIDETEPEGEHYQQWMLSQLDALDRALEGRR